MLIKNVRGHFDPLDLLREQVLDSNGSQVDQNRCTSRDMGPTVG